jgi:hypothetical protein
VKRTVEADRWAGHTVDYSEAPCCAERFGEGAVIEGLLEASTETAECADPLLTRAEPADAG